MVGNYDDENQNIESFYHRINFNTKKFIDLVVTKETQSHFNFSYIYYPWRVTEYLGKFCGQNKNDVTVHLL